MKTNFVFECHYGMMPTGQFKTILLFTKMPKKRGYDDRRTAVGLVIVCYTASSVLLHLFQSRDIPVSVGNPCG